MPNFRGVTSSHGRRLHPAHFPPSPTIIPDGGNYPVRLEADVPSGQPSPSHLSPACTRVSRWFAMAFGSNRLPALFYGVDLARPEGRALTHAFALSLPTSPRGPSLFRLIIAGIIATTASCASLPSTRTFPDSSPVIVPASRTTDLPCVASQAFATVPPPLHRRVH